MRKTGRGPFRPPILYRVKGNTPRFGFALQVLPSDIGEYFSSFFITVVVVVFISIFTLKLKNIFSIIVISCIRNKVLLTVLLQVITECRFTIIAYLTNGIMFTFNFSHLKELRNYVLCIIRVLSFFFVQYGFIKSAFLTYSFEILVYHLSLFWFFVSLYLSFFVFCSMF